MGKRVVKRVANLKIKIVKTIKIKFENSLYLSKLLNVKELRTRKIKKSFIIPPSGVHRKTVNH